MRKYLALLVAIVAFAACATPIDTDQKKKKETKPEVQPEAPAPAVATGQYSAVTEISATLDGTASNYDGLVDVEVGVLVSTSPAVYETEATRYPAAAITNGRFSVSITDLSRATKYYFRAYLSAEGVFLKGNAKSFTTSDIEATATVSDTSSFTIAGGTTVTGSVKVTASQAYPVTASLFWGKGINTAGKLASEGTEVPLTLDADGNFTATFGPFEYDATYYYTVKATVLDKVAYSQLKSFSTPGFEVTVTTHDATEVKDTVATLHGSYAVNYDAGYRLAKVFLYSTVEGTPQYWIDNNLITEEEGYVVVWSWVNSADFSTSVKKFKPSTTYYYAAAIGRLDDNWNVVSAWFGNVKSFTTTAKQQP